MQITKDEAMLLAVFHTYHTFSSHCRDLLKALIKNAQLMLQVPGNVLERRLSVQDLSRLRVRVVVHSKGTRNGTRELSVSSSYVQ